MITMGFIEKKLHVEKKCRNRFRHKIQTYGEILMILGISILKKHEKLSFYSITTCALLKIKL